jgi:hypothetical protein
MPYVRIDGRLFFLPFVVNHNDYSKPQRVANDPQTAVNAAMFLLKYLETWHTHNPLAVLYIEKLKRARGDYKRCVALINAICAHAGHIVDADDFIISLCMESNTLGEFALRLLKFERNPVQVFIPFVVDFNYNKRHREANDDQTAVNAADALRIYLELYHLDQHPEIPGYVDKLRRAGYDYEQCVALINEIGVKARELFAADDPIVKIFIESESLGEMMYALRV